MIRTPASRGETEADGAGGELDVVVIGGGLAGLAAACVAADHDARVVLVDRDHRGGRAATDDAGRFRFNRGAHALYRGGPGMAVLRQLGAEPSGARPPIRAARGRLGDATGPMLGFNLLGRRGRAQVIRTLAGALRWRPATLAETSAGAWLDDLDLRNDARLFLDMLVRTTTYAADPYRLSADAVTTYIRAGIWPGVVYPNDGWAQLVQRLMHAAKRRGVTVHTGRVLDVRAERSGVVVRTETGDALCARTAVVAAGTPDSCASLIEDRPPAWQGLGPPARIACVDLGLRRDPGVSVLISLDGPLYLSRHAPPAELASGDGAVVHVMRYLRPDEHLTRDAAQEELAAHARMAGIDVRAAEERRYLHEMTACSALPVPERGGMHGRPPVDTGLESLFVAGDWVGPTGHLAEAALASGAAAGAAAAVTSRARTRTTTS